MGVAANWLDGDFAADAPNRKWAGDITYIWTSEGWLYLAVILDLHSRRVVGWAVRDRMMKDLAIRALDMAVRLRQPPEDWFGSRQSLGLAALPHSIRIAAANIAHTTIRKSCRPMACVHR